MAANPADAGTQATADAAKAAAAQQAAATTTQQTNGQQQPQPWFYADGVEGKGERPAWYKGEKYKSVAEQAAAYPEAEKQIGTLTAKVKSLEPQPPPDTYALPDLTQFGGDLEWKTDDPLLKKAFEVAKELKLPQSTFDRLAIDVMMPLIRNYEMIDPVAQKKSIGDRADERMQGFDTWAKANLSEEQYQAVTAVLGKWSQPHEVFLALETLLTATRQPGLHKAGDDVSTTMTKADWDAKWYAKSEQKNYRYKIDEPGNRQKAQAELAQIVGTGDHIEVVGKR